PNGSGKSKALELLLPFLFDANLRANRLSTFGTSERTMHWNLMGEGASGTTRVGYVWLEFRFSATPERWFSCGARLQASTHTTTVHADYFTTTLRIGELGGLALVNDTGQPLTKIALVDRLGEHGVLHDNAGDYRAAVRSTLFPGLSEQRYDALITALLQLRTPKLSQRLDPSLLSTLLSRALPPLGQQEIADLAEGFERLDAQREKLATLEQEVAATSKLAARQRTYAQRVLRAGAATLISATTELDNLARTARRSAEEYDQVAEQQAAAEARGKALEHELANAEARRAGLTESEAYKQGQELDRLRAQTAAAAANAGRIHADAARQRTTAEADELSARQANQTVRTLSGVVRTQETEVRHAAARAGLTSVHEELVSTLDTNARQVRPLLRAAVRSRQRQLDAVGRALDAHDHAVDRRKQAETDLDLARGALSTAGETLEAAITQRELALTELGSRLMAWADDCRELVFPDPTSLLEHLESEPALLAAVDSAAAAVAQEITVAETTCAAARKAGQAEREALIAALDAVTGQRDIAPAAPPTRTTDRATMPGAPLWRLVDFAETTPEDTHAGIEAALEASGLLDAWLGPRGDIAGHDVFADPEALAPVTGRSLADVLVPERDTDVATDVIRRLLAAIAVGDRLPVDGTAAIGTDGTWRMGSLTGSWHKGQPAHIGAPARQRARERRARELRDLIAHLDTRIGAWDAELAALRTRREVLANERAARPPYAVVAEATKELTRAESDLATAETVVRQRVSTVTDREREVTQALRELTGLAAENGVPTQRSALDTVAAAIGSFADQADAWLDEHDRLASARQVADAVTTQAQRSAENARAREDEATEAEENHQTLAVRLEAIENAFGMDYRDVLAEIGALRTTLHELGEQRRGLNRRLTDLAGRLGALGTQRTTDAAVRDAAAGRRDTAAHRFRHLATGILPADSGFDDLAAFETTLAASAGVRAALDTARLVAAAWPAIPHAPNNLGDALHRLSESVHDCRDTLRSRADLDLETDEDVQVFTAVVDGLRVGAAELLTILRGEAEQSRQEITDRERELFDQTLTGDTRRHLAARIRQANELVDGMNARLERVRTASKVAVRLVWQIAPDLPPGTKTARDLLLRDPVGLTEADRDSLHRFFRERIEQARADDTATSWEQQLAQVFDYTSWHQFVVKVDRANGAGWQLLTRKLHGALSGGEKAIALHLPLFAAVAAHYQAVPEAPRVILLDEVFVGVDSTNRGQVFALLSALELDLMLTSDHEWCTYAELSGVGIHQLITGDDGDDAVTTARFTWNGHALLPVTQQQNTAG
ncbi:MAG: TIGR02680 family protein, partial [Pseudonocardiaceae bacterium]